MKEQKTPAISVIVPVYNAAQTVETAVRSLLNQTFTDFEVIIIEDGSTDQTRGLLQKLAPSDPRVKIIFKEKNEGLSAGRNTGIAASSGTYVGFLDADDWIEPDFLETVYSRGILQDADLILSGYSHDTMDPGRTQVSVSRKVRTASRLCTEKTDIIEAAAFCDTHKMFAYTWNKFYRKQLIADHSMCFQQQTLIEDFIFNCQFWNRIQRLAILDSTGYHYVKASSEALTQKFLPDYYEIIDLRYRSIRRLMTENGCFRGSISEQLGNMHIKHLLAGMIRDRSPKSGYNRKERIRRIRKALNSSSGREAAALAKGRTIQEIVCNLIFKSHCVLLNLLFTSLLSLMQTHSSSFDRLK